MGLLLRKSINWTDFNIPVSYSDLAQNRLNDASNVYTNRNLLQCRNALVRWNTTAVSAEDINSITYFRTNADASKVVAKAGTVLYLADETAASTSIKTGLTSANKHRAVSFGGRHYILIGSDGLYQYDGVTFSALGQTSGSAATVAASGAGATLPTATYRAYYTYYDSVSGFESNISAASSNQAITLGQNLVVSALPSTATNTFIDKLRVYIENVTTSADPVFWVELDLGTTTTSVNLPLTSTSTAPENASPPISGGGLYPVIFGNQLAYAGNSSFQSDVFFSEPDNFNAFDQTATSRTLFSSGSGPVTGLGVGFYNSDSLSPFLCIFKRSSIEVFSELGGTAVQQTISNEIGCISHDTIKTIDGRVYFMSANGWFVIDNGRLAVTADRKPFSLGEGDIDDIFTKNGFVYELNRSDFNDFFSVYHPNLNHYMNFVSEGSNDSISKSYNFEFSIGGFRPFTYNVALTCGTLAVESNGGEQILFGGKAGKIYKYSIRTGLTDIDESGSDIAINPFVMLYWVSGEDMDCTYNFGDFILRGISQDEAIKANYYTNFSRSSPTQADLSLAVDETGFVLDLSQLDVDAFGNERQIATARSGIYVTAESLLIYLYQPTIGANMSLIKGQLDVSKNQNPAL